MNPSRRDVLALLASAPIAALAPWPHFLPKPKLMFRADVFALTMAPLPASAEWIGVIYGRGFFRRGNELWEYRAPLSAPRLPVQRFDPTRLPN